MEAFISGLYMKIVGKASSMVALDVQFVRHVLRIARVLRLSTYTETSACHSVRSQFRARARCMFHAVYGRWIMWRLTRYTVNLYIITLCRPAGMYGTVKRCLINDARTSGGCCAVNWFMSFFALLFLFDQVYCRFMRGLLIEQYALFRVML